MLYEDKDFMNVFIHMLKERCKEKQFVIWRAPFRWMDDNGVLSNCYDSFTLESVCEANSFLIIEDFCHAAIVEQG